MKYVVGGGGHKLTVNGFKMTLVHKKSAMNTEEEKEEKEEEKEEDKRNWLYELPDCFLFTSSRSDSIV